MSFTFLYVPNKITNFRKESEDSGATAKAAIHPKSIHHATKWSEDVENFYRFQQAGYRDEIEYKQVKQVDMVRFRTLKGLLI